jgi:two-component system cell cycle sensor histidine kinase/response regulator CckA
MNTFPISDENRRWLLVDDNADMLLMLSAVLARVTSANLECHDTPQSALAALIAAPQQYELVITDFQMPEMDGVELCRRLRQVAPEQKVILATGSGYFSPQAARRAGFCALLNKPFPLAELTAALAAAGIENEAACPV